MLSSDVKAGENRSEQPEPHYCEVGSKEHRAVQALLFQIGIEEKNWPVLELARLLSRESQLVGVFSDGECVGGLQVIYRHPFPCEKPPFEFKIPKDGRIVGEAALIGIAKKHRRMASDDTEITVLNALAKGLFLHGRSRNLTHGYTLCEEWTCAIFDGYLKDDIKIVSGGAHYWCESNNCPCEQCRLTYVCEISLEGTARRWESLRPRFWEYVNQ